jgi:glycogen operon protein
LKDLTWYFDIGAEVDQTYFQNPDNHFLAYQLDGSEFGDPAVSVYVAYNGWFNPISATLPAPLQGNSWYLVADTSSAAEPWGNIHSAGQEVKVTDPAYTVQGRSVVLLIER